MVVKINDEKYNSNPVGQRTAIRRATRKEDYILASCRLFGRGFDHKSKDKKVHAGFHIDDRSSIVELIQNIWRFINVYCCY